ncbi:hypothetical protein QEN19_001220 [Hanseniaspora menglaensis]
MNLSGSFVKEVLLSKSKGDIDSLEERIKPHLVVAPLQKKILKAKNDKFELKKGNHNGPILKHLLKQNSYKVTNKISKIALNSYIKGSKINVKKAKGIISKKNKLNNTVLSKQKMYACIEKDHAEVFKSLPPSYEKMYENLYLKMWVPYIHQVLKIDISKSYKETLNKLNLQVCLLKLAISDYNGCKIKITKTENKSLMGKEGIVIWDSQKSFIIVCKNEEDTFNEIKIIPKKKSIFEIRVPVSIDIKEEVIFHIIGDRFQHRSSDRVGKKFKNKNTKDISYYIFNDDLYKSSNSS